MGYDPRYAGEKVTTQSTIGRRPAKNALFDGFAAVAGAMANGRRAEIIELLAQGERSVEHVADAIDQSVANTSHHLRRLARAGLVSTRRDGTRIYYRLTDERVYDLWVALRDVTTRHLDDIDQLTDAYLGNRTEITTITRSELQERLQRDQATLIDVRPRAEYDAGHIPGAIPIPPDQLDELLPSLPADREIVAYCRGPYCVYADQAVRSLLARGRAARRLEDGYPEWQRSGGPVEKSLLTIS
ncbi:MAG: metalloregulator ArsR/SmtB family transcription factor [Acidobacteria bacterium]|nr:metalloregulator ArsR/SmtB family transcription factor [Acidobacteriota bacterium]